MNRQPRLEPHKFNGTESKRSEVMELERKGEFFLSCGVANVKVKMNGEVVGKTDPAGKLYLVSLDTGFYMLLLSHPHYHPRESLVHIQEWRLEIATLTLVPLLWRRLFDFL